MDVCRPRYWMLLALAARALSAGDYVGAEACRSCHPTEYHAQQASRHSLALRPIIDTPVASLLAGAPIQERSGIAFEYAPETRGLLLIVSKGRDRLEANLEWAFGAGAQAYTPVGRRNGRYFEHRVSFYTSAARPGRTLGHPAEASSTLEGALGIVQDSETIYRCFNCHATGVRPGPDLTNMRPGVGCERCHGPASAHVAGARIGSFSKLSAADSVRVCAQCHRAPSATSGVPEKVDPLSIRFQPIGLMASRCFGESGKLSCITCHNPHENARGDAEYYVAKCVGCHDPKSAPRHKACGLVQRQNCLPCHMQRRSPVEFLTFTDHRIRIYP